MKVYISYIALLIFVFAGQNGLAQEDSRNVQEIDGVIAIVADEIILRSDVESQFKQYAESGMEVGPNTRCVLFEDLLVQKLLVHQAKVVSIVVEEAEVRSELDRRIQYFVAQIGSVERLEQFYEKSIEEIRAEFYEVINEQLLVQRMQGQITSAVKVTPKEIKEFYNSIPEDSLPFVNAEVKLAQLTINPEVSQQQKEETRAKLNALRERIVKGEDFGTLAYLYSEDPGSAQQNGELGFMRREQLVPEFAAAAFDLEKGEISQVVETDFGYHIIEMIERKGQELNARHILLKPKVNPSDLILVKDKLDSIYNEIETNDSVNFELMVQEYSDDKESKNNAGVMLNPQTGSPMFEVNTLNQYDPNLFYTVDRLKVGDLSKPVMYEKQDGTRAYRILKLVTYTDPHVANLDQDYQRVMNAKLGEKKQTELADWIEKTIAENYIRIDASFENCAFSNNWFN